MPKVVFAADRDWNADTWMDALRTALPDVDIVNFNELDESSGASIAIAWKPPENLLARETSIKAIFNLGAGVDSLLQLPGLNSDITIVRLEDAGMSVQMAEYVTYAVLRVSRQLARYEAQSRQHIWQTHADIERQDWPVGVMGQGVIGTRVAKALAHFEYPVAGWSRSGKDIENVEKFAGDQQFDAFLQRTRVLVNVLPLTPETEGILNKANMQKLKSNAYIINVGRGEHLIADDLLALLDEGHVMGAMMDVFAQEPLPQNHPLFQDERMVVTPHIAAASLQRETVEQIADKIRNYLADKPVSGVVAHGSGY